MNFLNKRTFIFNYSLALLIGLTACTQDSKILSVESKSQSESSETRLIDGGLSEESSFVSEYVEDKNFYTPVLITISNGSFLRIPNKSLVPPEYLSGENVEITMTVTNDQENNELLFQFGPHGCEFSSPAELCLSWKTTNSKNATLYYLDEQGNRKEHLPDQVDVVNKRMIIYINHFSRYAVAYSN
ncbi:MAG: hypothetical protein JW956_01015 [Calditrichaceae bacterium]|nr:hypothetical protein [Calditrichaceae bacterium]